MTPVTNSVSKQAGFQAKHYAPSVSGTPLLQASPRLSLSASPSLPARRPGPLRRPLRLHQPTERAAGELGSGGERIRVSRGVSGEPTLSLPYLQLRGQQEQLPRRLLPLRLMRVAAPRGWTVDLGPKNLRTQ